MTRETVERLTCDFCKQVELVPHAEACRVYPPPPQTHWLEARPLVLERDNNLVVLQQICPRCITRLRMAVGSNG